MGSITVSQDFQTVWGNKRVSVGKITMSSSYATNGDSYTPTDFGLSKLTKLVLNQPASGRVLSPDEANKKVKAYTNAGVEITATTDISADVVNYIAIE